MNTRRRIFSLSQASPVTAPSRFQSSFGYALQEYKKRTKEDLFLHPLAARLQSCDSPGAIVSVLEEQSRPFDQSRSGDERSIQLRWLRSIVNVLYFLSGSIEEGAAMVLSPAKVIFVGIGVLLSAAQAVGPGEDALVDIFESMERFFQRLETYIEVLSTASMKDMNEQIMLVVLSILATLTEEIRAGRTKKYWKKKVARAEVKDALQRLDKLTLHMANSVGPLTTLTVSPVSVESSNTVTWQQLHDDIREWLSPSDPSTNYNAALKARHEGTVQWFLKSKTYTEWKSSSSLLWVHGKPGSGKSVLCSLIIEDIGFMCKVVPAYMAYFVFDSEDDHKQSCHDVAASILTQLSTQSDRCFGLLSRLYSSQNRGAGIPTSYVLTECLKDMLLLPGQSPVYIIMDAIDECPNTCGVPSPREEILELLKELVDLCLPNLWLCVTCRPEIDIRTLLEPLCRFRLSLQDELGQKQDIVKYVSDIVDSDPNFGTWRGDDKQLVIDTLCEKAHGMFRSVSCQVDNLRHSLPVPSTIRRILNEYPKTLDETYEHILMEIDITKRKCAHRLLQCVVVAVRPLRVDALAEILAMDFDAGKAIPELNVHRRLEDPERAVLSVCSCLFDVVNLDGSRVVQFCHPSAREFLTSERLAVSRGRVSHYRVDLEHAHAILAQACLGVLLRLDNHFDLDNLKRFPLAEYAARYWVNHARFENVASNIRNGMELLFDSEKPHFANWVKIYDMDKPLGSPVTHPTRPHAGPLYYAILCDLPELAKYLIVAHPKDVDSRGGRYTTAIHAALYRGHLSIARLLIENGAEVNSRDADGSTPLHIAAQNGHPELVELLLSFNADANATKSGHSPPLVIASNNGNLEVIRLLLHHGANVNVQDDKSSTPLHITSGNGNSNAVWSLLEYGANIYALDNHASTPLHLASVRGNPMAVEWLVQRGADVNALDVTNSTPLHLALVNENFDVVKLLIQHGANVSLPNHKKSTPLHLAALSGSANVVELLLQSGADVNSEGNNKWTPLHLSSGNGSHEVVKLLLDGGANVNARDDKRSTPLHIASRHGPSKLVKLLLERGRADPNAQNEKGCTPLHVASQEGAIDIVQCLLERGAEVNLGDGAGRTPLHVASDNKNVKIVALLIEHGADPALQDAHTQMLFQLRSESARPRASTSWSSTPRAMSVRTDFPSGPGSRHTGL